MGFASYYEDILDRLLNSDLSVSTTMESPEEKRLKSNIQSSIEEVRRLQTQVELAMQACEIAGKSVPYNHDKALVALGHLNDVTNRQIAASERGTRAALELVSLNEGPQST